MLINDVSKISEDEQKRSIEISLSLGLEQLIKDTEAIMFSSSEFSADDEDICCESLNRDFISMIMKSLQNIIFEIQNINGR